jgi:hypothetical protein
MRWLAFTLLLACKGDPKPAASTNPGSDEKSAGSNTETAVRQRPALPDQKPSKAANDSFEDEQRDNDWAPPVETELKERFQKMRGGAKLDNAECRQSRCRLTIVGSEGDMAQTIADLEGPRGLHGYAKHVLLTAPVQKPDGTIELRAIASFDR